MNNEEKWGKKAVKPSFSKRIRAELGKIDFTARKKTINIAVDEREKSKEEFVSVRFPLSYLQEDQKKAWDSL